MRIRIALLFACVVSMHAQTTTGTLFGVVRDTSGAVLPQVEVKATQTSTSLARIVKTDDQGEYLITNLPIGQYSLAAEKAGFRRFIQEGFVQAFDFGPKPDTCHCKLPLETLLKISIKPGVLRLAELEIVRDVDRVGGRLPIRKEGADRLQPDFMGDDAQAALLGNVARHRLGEELAIEDHDRARADFIHETPELLGNVPGR